MLSAGKTTICNELARPTAGHSGRPQRCLNRRLLAHHSCQAGDRMSQSVAGFVLSLVKQLAAKDSQHFEQLVTRLSSDPEVILFYYSSKLIVNTFVLEEYKDNFQPLLYHLQFQFL